MKVLFILISFVLTATSIHAQGTLHEESVDLETLYQQLDDAIANSSQYVAERENQIKSCRDSMLTELNPEKRLQLADRLYRLYRPYKNEVAIQCAEQYISLADSLHRPDLAGRYRSLLAQQCSRSDMLTESLEQLHLVKRPALTNKELIDYYSAWMHVCGEMANLTQRKDMHQRYLDKQNLYRDSVMAVAAEGSEDYFHLKMDILTAQRHFQDALNLNDQWLKTVKEGTHERAFAAFYRSQVFDRLTNHDQTCYWLGQSALDDIRCAVMDQASLLFLAEHLANDGDLDRAERYMDFSRKCNNAFSSHTRNYQYSSILNIVQKGKEAAEHQSHQVLIIVLIVAAVVIFLLILALILIIRKRRS